MRVPIGPALVEQATQAIDAAVDRGHYDMGLVMAVNNLTKCQLEILSQLQEISHSLDYLGSVLDRHFNLD